MCFNFTTEEEFSFAYEKSYEPVRDVCRIFVQLSPNIYDTQILHTYPKCHFFFYIRVYYIFLPILFLLCLAIYYIYSGLNGVALKQSLDCFHNG